MANADMEKAVILARGLGTRMRKQDDGAVLGAEQAAMAETGVKALMPIDRPFLDYVLHALAEAGYKRVCLVIGPEHDVMREYYGRQLRPKRLTIEFAVQEKPLGTANAVAAGEEFAAGDPFLVINSDNYYPIEAMAGLRKLGGSGLAVFEREAMIAQSNIAADRITKFAVVQTNERGQMERIVEKPSEEVLRSLPEPICVSMNCWRFSAKIFEACRAIPLSARGEYEIPDAVEYTMKKLGETYQVLSYRAGVLDMSCRADIPAVAAKLAGSKVWL